MSLRTTLTAVAAAGLIAAGTLAVSAASAQDIVRAPAPALDPADAAPSETAVFAGGCFWGVQGVFQRVKGVTATTAGYTGGRKGSADYETVSTGTTGHAESVRVTFDPRVVSYGRLLQVYFSVVTDPTMLNAQGPDEGTQYRSALFPATPLQGQVARAYLGQLSAAKLWKRPIVTRIEPLGSFYPAEAYHQDYLVQHPDSGYIRVNDMPKVKALQSLYPQLTRAQAVRARA